MKKTISFFICVMMIGVLMAGCSADNDAARNNSAPGHVTTDAAPRANESADREPMASYNNTTNEDMNFQDYGTNPYVATKDDSLSTFAIDVDTGAYTIARSYIHDGNLPPQEAVRLEEFVNYFNIQYEPPTKDTFAIHVDAGESPLEEQDEQLVRIGIKGKEVTAEERTRANLTFVIDISGSMDRDNRIDLVKNSLELLIKQLRADDHIGIVVYGSTARQLLKPTPVKEKNRILDALNEIEIEGATNVADGLMLGYKMANESFDSEAINRIILCSDGVANIGETGPEGILAQIERYTEQEIYLSTFGYGMGNYNDVLMEQLADKGNGTYAYIDDMKEPRRTFQEQLTGTLQTIAKDVKIQVEFDPEKVDQYRLLGYENRAIADEDFRNHRVDGGEVGAGHTITALYKVKLNNEAAGDLGHITIRYKNVDDNNEMSEITQAIRLSDELSEETLFLAAVAAFAEIIGGADSYDEARLEDVRRLASKTAVGEEQKEFVQLIGQVLDLG
jgi:Ca-activated chloride channel family protein